MSSLGGLITGDLNRVLDVNRPSTCKSYCNPYQRQLENGRLCPTRLHQSNCRLLVGIYTGKILSATVNKIELATQPQARSQNTISLLSPAPSSNCKKLKSSGRTRADARVCAARPSRPSRRGSRTRPSFQVGCHTGHQVGWSELRFRHLPVSPQSGAKPT